MQSKRIVITGGPSSGKTTIIKQLEKEKFHCFEEISRVLIRESQSKGIPQPFLTDPLGFSKSLLLARIRQFKDAEKTDQPFSFYDRGIHDIVAYMRYAGEKTPLDFHISSKSYQYDNVFILPPWGAIHTNDNERYESFEQATQIFDELWQTYVDYGYSPVQVPLGSVEKRTQFILDNLQS